ncbi:MAG: hypothetical protein D5S03_04420 [Desulfonatronospira sp. MSAO_Bac3]|nr:MAG: hypothetical protein D5S03_04420 [Desulfonatronospira sp. MSAO_Bac3]
MRVFRPAWQNRQARGKLIIFKVPLLAALVNAGFCGNETGLAGFWVQALYRRMLLRQEILARQAIFRCC